MDLSKLLKEKELEREGSITVLIDVTVQVDCLMEKYSSVESFGFAMAVLGSTRKNTTVNKMDLIDLQRIMPP